MGYYRLSWDFFTPLLRFNSRNRSYRIGDHDHGLSLCLVHDKLKDETVADVQCRQFLRRRAP